MTQESARSASEQAQQPLLTTKQYEQSLAHLERLQEQIDGLRSALPAVVAPLLKPNASRAQMFAEVRKAALQSTNDLKAFREDYEGEQTQVALAWSTEGLKREGS